MTAKLTNPALLLVIAGFEGALINVTDICNGKWLAEICDSQTGLIAQTGEPPITYTVAEALSGVTAMFYDETTTEILTGNRDGMVHAWARDIYRR